MHVYAIGYFRFSNLEKDLLEFSHVCSGSGWFGLNFLELVEKWQEDEVCVSVSLNFPHKFSDCVSVFLC